jgi:hypothetical protein
LLLALAALVWAAGCSGAEGGESASPPSRAASGATGASGHGSHGHVASAAGLEPALLRAADLPRGFTPSALHGSHGSETGGTPPQVSPACAPIATLIGTHPAVQQHRHPQVGASFTRSHFGPYIEQRVIDYGRSSAASRAARAVEEAGRDCGRYEQSRSQVGANTYTVRPFPAPHGGGDGVAVRLEAAGRQFRGLNWDVWATQADGRLVSVAFRSVPGGDNDDWHAVVQAALAALNRPR